MLQVSLTSCLRPTHRWPRPQRGESVVDVAGLQRPAAQPYFRRLSAFQRRTQAHAASERAIGEVVEQRRELRQIPRITYSSDWKAVNVLELERLLEAAQPTRRSAKDSNAARPGLSFQRQFGLLPGCDRGDPEERRQKLARMLTHSMCFVGAYARADSMPGFVHEPEPEGEGEENWAWVVERRRRGRAKQLVGFARASGDCELVSTLYDVVVHPDLQGLGMGKRLIRRICQSVFSLSIGDVAVMAPEHLYPFFEACSFGPDQVCDSSLMAYLADPQQDEPDPSAHLKHESLTALMRAKLHQR